MQRFIRLIFFVLLTLSGSTLFAQEPTFLIEKIEVRGTRFTSSTVIARQTLLKEGTAYTEPQLKAAIDRLNRLPFVIDAEFSREKGSEREHYILVVTVSEMKPFFVNAESLHTRTESDLGDSPWFEQNNVFAGVRGFVGSTLLHAAANQNGSYEAGVTQYDLFGSSAYASFRLRWTDRRAFYSFSDPIGGNDVRSVSKADPSPELIVGVPIVGNHSVRATLTRSGFDSTATITSSSSGTGQSYEARQKQHQNVGDLAWVYDSTDDGLFPTRGRLMRSGLYVIDADTLSRQENEPEVRQDFQMQTLYMDGRQYWQLPYGQSISAGLGAARTRTPFPESPINQPPQYTNSYTAVASYSASLWPRKQTVRLGELRFETEGHYWRYSSYGSPTYYIIRNGVTFRNSWALLHLTFDYNGQGNS
jgi:outer membrane protein assembly factor BamA